MLKISTLFFLCLLFFSFVVSFVFANNEIDATADDDNECFLTSVSEFDESDQVLKNKSIGVLSGKHLIVIPWGVVQYDFFLNLHTVFFY